MGNKNSKGEAGKVKPEEKDEVRSSEMIRSIVDDPVVGEYLKQVPLVSKLTSEERDKLGGALVEKLYRDGAPIFNEGDQGNGFYIIREGECEVYRSNKAGDQALLAKLSKGDYFGESALIKNNPRSASVYAKGPVKTYFLDKTKFQVLFSEERLRVHFANRRAAVTAEGMAGLGGTHYDDMKKGEKVSMPDDIRELMLESINQNILFESLNQEHKVKLLDHMLRINIPTGESTIKQGDLGTCIYFVEQGTFDVWVKDADTGKQIKVATRERGESFGELALMYNVARSATVTAAEDSVVWSVDRFTFRRIAQNLGETRLKQYIEFMHRVHLLSALAEYEREKIAEALEEVVVKEGHTIFKQGEIGDGMYIIGNGKVLVSKEGDDSFTKTLKVGDYFGERALIKNEPRAASVIAKTKCHLLKLDKAAFDLLLGPLQEIFDEREKSYEKKKETPGKAIGTYLRNDIPFEELETLGTLGKGSFGHVTLVKWPKEGKSFALKAVSKQQIVETRQQGHILSEKNALASLNHPLIIKLYSTFKDKNMLYFLLEPSLGGELFTLLRKHRTFSLAESRFYAASVVLVFEYMHSMHLVYRDLKPENLLLDSEGYIKVTDFGFAKKVKNKTWTLCGTPEYLAPEIVAGKGHGKGVDWWTVGILIFEMLASFTPFYHEDHMNMYSRIARGKISFPPHFNSASKDIIKKLLNIVPTKRLGVTQGGAKTIKKHQWFSKFDFQGLFDRKLKGPIVPDISDPFDMQNFDNVSDKSNNVREYKDDGTNWEADF